MWIANAEQLQRFMEHPFWNKMKALNHKMSMTGLVGKRWGYPERSNSMNIFIDVPNGAPSKCMVPFSFSSNNVSYGYFSPLGRVDHLRNGYPGVGLLMDKVLMPPK